MSMLYGDPMLVAPPLTAVAALPIGAHIGAWAVLRVLHEGRHGFVYLARDPARAVTAVLKEFVPRLRAVRLADGAVMPRRADDSIAMSVAREAFAQEATALAGVRHARLVRVLGLFHAQGTLYRVMPLYDGVTLEHRCRGRGVPPNAAWLAGVVDDLLQALEALHAHGYAHGRVQPDQVLLSRLERATLLGFGSAARELSDLPRPPWRAPEVAGTRRHAPPTMVDDLYALAATAWFAAGTAARVGGDTQLFSAPGAVRERLAVLSDGPGDTPARRHGLVNAIESALATCVHARPQNIAEFRRLLHGEPVLRAVGANPAPPWVGEAAVSDKPEMLPPLVVAVQDQPPAGSAKESPIPGPDSAPNPVPEPVPVPQPEPEPEPELAAASEPEPQPMPEAAFVPASVRVPAPVPRRTGWRLAAMLALAVAGGGLLWWAAGLPADGVATEPTMTSGPLRPEAEVSPQLAIQSGASGVALADRSSAAIAPAPVESAAAPASEPPELPSAIALAEPAAAQPAGAAPALRDPVRRVAGKPLKLRAATLKAPAKIKASAIKPKRGARSAAASRAPASVCATGPRATIASCMRQQCAKSAYQSHRQCIALRRSG